MINLGSDEEIDENKPSVKNLRRSEKVVSLFLDYFYKYIVAKDIKIDPFDTLILKAHYSFTSHLLLTVFILVTSHWFIEEPMICVDKSDKSAPFDDLLDICASYPYVEYPFNNDKNKMVRRYALYYRWVHIACLILSFVFKGVVLMRKIFSLEKHRQMLEEICKEKRLGRFWVAKKYFSHHKGCHKNMYARFLYVHLSALLINIVCFAGLNITFQNHYWDLPKKLLVERDPTSFHDEFSLIFPPFAECEITPVHHILIDRTKKFGCHLPLMEIYEKIFMMFWFWQVFLGVWTALFIVVNIPLPFLPFWKRRLLINGSLNNYAPFSTGAKSFETDDVFALSSITSLIMGDDYARLLHHLIGKDDLLNPNETTYDPNQSSRDSTLFRSCLQDENKKEAPIGFEGFASSPIPCTSFSPMSSSTMQSTPENNFNNDPYSAWKRSVSLEFNMVNINSLGFNTKIEPLMKYLNRDTSGGKSTPAVNNPAPSAPQNESNVSWKKNSSKSWPGGEKRIEENWDNNADENWGNEYDQPVDNNDNNQWTSNCFKQTNVGWGNKNTASNNNNNGEECWDEEQRSDNADNFGKIFH